MTNKLKEIPDETNNPFVDLRWLLSKKVTSVAVIATAIETSGIYTWDKYGRYKKFDKSTPEAARALTLLGYIYEYENTHQLGEISEQHPLDKSEGVDDEYYKYGWAHEVLPNFQEIQHNQGEVPKPVNGSSMKGDNANLRIIAALLKYIKGETTGVKKHPSYRDSEADLIEILGEEYSSEGEGFSKRNLEDKFAEAKRILG
jgi:hypothetical protein